MIKKLIVGMALIATVALGACTNVEPGEVGVKLRRSGAEAGVDPVPLGVGWTGVGLGESVVIYPVVQKTFNYENVQISDKTGLPIGANVAITLKIDPAKAPKLYERYRLDQDQLINGPILAKTRAAMRTALSKYSSEELYQGKDQLAVLEAAQILQSQYESQGITILSLDLIGRLGFPDSVLAAITNKTTLLQGAEAAKANEAKAIADANTLIAQAKGEAEATRIRGEALRSNPQILQQEWIAKWNGTLPTTVAGGDTSLLLNIPDSK